MQTHFAEAAEFIKSHRGALDDFHSRCDAGILALRSKKSVNFAANLAAISKGRIQVSALGLVPKTGSKSVDQWMAEMVDTIYKSYS